MIYVESRNLFLVRMVVTQTPMNADEFELHCIKSLTSGSPKSDPSSVFEELSRRIVADIKSSDTSSASEMRSQLSPWWKVVGTCVDAGLAVTHLTGSQAAIRTIISFFGVIKAALDDFVSSAGLDPSSRDTALMYGGFNLAYTSATRAALESIHCIADPSLACEILMGLESCIPIDSKGNANVYKRTRQVEDDSVRETLSQITPDTPNESFEEGNVVLGESSKAFERFWTMMDVSRRNEPDLLTETKAWGRFSQSATSTLNLLLDQPDSLDALSWVSREPVEYACNLHVFPIQMSSASFRRRAIFNMLFMCSYVAQSSSNALITAAAKTLHSNILKSLPNELQQTLQTVTKFDHHWVAWKSSAHSKEVCGPFDKRSRVERNMEPFGEPLVDLSTVDLSQLNKPASVAVPNAAIGVIETGSMSGHVFESSNGELYADGIKRKISDYRQYVKDAILCDISDETELERLAASDEGMEEAMRNNNDRVLLWQFRRMRFASDIKSFAKPKPLSSAPASGETTPMATPTPEPEPMQQES